MSLDSLDELYQEVILDHYRRPRNKEPLPDADLTCDGVNPLCGDEIHLYFHLEGDVVQRVTFQGKGCAISQASGSMLTEAIKGKTLAEAKSISDAFKEMMLGDGPADSEVLGDLEALHGVKQFPVRIKCALLSWHVLDDVLSKEAG